MNARMRIAINIRLWLPGRLDGIGWFTAETVRRMVLAHPEHQFLLLCDRRVDLEWKLPHNARQVSLFPPARHPVLWYLFFEWGVATALRRLKADLFLSTDGWMSLRTKVPTLTVIHDINYEHADDYLRPSHQRYMKRFFPRFARKAERIATVSQFSRRDLAAAYRLDPDKIDVVYDGSHAAYRPLDEPRRQAAQRRYAQGCPYFIFIGTITPRKNLAGTLRAFDLFKETDATGAKMLVVGSRAGRDEGLEQALEAMRHKEDALFLGRVQAQELATLLASATALAYVSLFEGFGIPILEAFQAETAVIASNVTSMPEVAGEAALLVDPRDTRQIANAMTLLSTNEALRGALIAKGREQRKLFSWDRTAALLWDSLMKTYHKK